MNILYTAKSPLAGVCELMTRCVNSYCRTKYNARCLNAGAGKHKWYAREPEFNVKDRKKKLVPNYSIKNKDHVKECIEWADVIHCMANVGIRSHWFKAFSREDLLKKKWVFQWHGAQVWPFERVFLPEDYKHVSWIHIGQGWVERQMDFFGKFIGNYNMRVVPNIITADDRLHSPMNWEDRTDFTAFTPSQSKDTAVNGKGIKVTMAALRGTKYRYLCGVTFEKCLRTKRKCKLGIDEVVTPMYHRSGLEFLAQGTPCICSMSEEAVIALKKAVGCSKNPFINETPNSLRRRIKWYWAIPDSERKSMGRESREWIDEYYHPRQLIERYIDIYEERSDVDSRFEPAN